MRTGPQNKKEMIRQHLITGLGPLRVISGPPTGDLGCSETAIGLKQKHRFWTKPSAPASSLCKPWGSRTSPDCLFYFVAIPVATTQHCHRKHGLIFGLPAISPDHQRSLNNKTRGGNLLEDSYWEQMRKRSERQHKNENPEISNGCSYTRSLSFIFFKDTNN